MHPVVSRSRSSATDPRRNEAAGDVGPACGGGSVTMAADIDMSPRGILSRVFGFPDFRGLQQQAVDQVMAGEDCLVLMPTGGGKSVCYQVPALSRPGTGLVISPLIALMDDQVAALRQLGVNAGALHSEQEADDAARVRSDLASGRLDILYVSPERLLSPGMLERLSRLTLSVIAIDEAHCISAWGHEFRPEYRALATLPDHFPGVPRIALTATADPRTQSDILEALAMPDATVLKASFHRPNLDVVVRPKTSEMRQLVGILDRHRGEAGIVYCGSRNKTERIAKSLCDRGYVALAFHAGLSPVEKRAALMRFRSGEAVIIVATIAFGMGIDRPDVRTVVHLDMPSSPEGYYQQIGRAGRDGEAAETVLLYGGDDIARARYWLEQSNAPEAQRRIMSARLEAMIALAETTGCRTEALLACFGERLEQPCGHCDNCRNPAVTFDGTVAAQKVLSAIYRTGQRFGAVHVAAVLRGKTSDMATRHGHDRLSVYGIGKDRPEAFWRGVIRQLIARGAIRVSGEYNALSLDEARARPILRGEEVVSLREDATDDLRAAAAGERRGGSGRFDPDTLAPEVAAVFRALKAWRLGEAREQEIPPYVIFHDAVLHDIAQEHPTSLHELGTIKGVGSSKLERYGDAVLQVLSETPLT